MKKQNMSVCLAAIVAAMLTVISMTVYSNDNRSTVVSPSTEFVVDIKVNQHNTNEIYAVVAKNGLYKSTDKGETWIYCDIGIPNNDYSRIEFDPVNRIIYARTSSALFRSYDFKNWVKLAEFRWLSNIFIRSTDQSKILYVHTSDGLYFSKDERAWEKIDRPEPYSNTDFYLVAIDRADPGIVYFMIKRPMTFVHADEVEAYKSSGLWKADDSGIYKSRDQGKTVERMLSTRSDILLISPSDANVMYSADRITTGVGADSIMVSRILKSIDRGASWEVQCKLDLIIVERLIANPVDHNELYAIIMDYRHLQNNNYDLEVSTLDDLPQSKQVLLKSSDGGKTWQDISLGSPFNNKNHIASIAVDALNPEVLYIGAAYGFFKSADAGKTWKAIKISK